MRSGPGLEESLARTADVNRAARPSLRGGRLLQMLVLTTLGLSLSVAPSSAQVTQAMATPVVTQLELPVNDIVYSSITDTIYASLSGAAGRLGNRIVEIDPDTGALGRAVWVGSEPHELAVSDDGRYLYVAVIGSFSIRRIDLQSFTAGLEFPVGGSPADGPYYAAELEVMPGQPDIVVVSRDGSGGPYGIAAFDDGVQLPGVVKDHVARNVIEFGAISNASGLRLYGYGSRSSPNAFSRMWLSASGVSLLDDRTDLLSGNIDIEFSDGKIYSTRGKVIDPETGATAGTYGIASPGPVEPDPDRDKVYFVSSGSLYEFDEGSYLFPVRQTPIIDSSSTAWSLIEIGGGDLAFRTSTHVYFIRLQSGSDTSAPTVTIPADLDVEATGSNGAVVSYSASANDNVDGAVPTSCSPASGTQLPIGISTVVCTATDAAGNAAAASFTVAVRRPFVVAEIEVPANHLAFDSHSNTIYASVPGWASPYGNHVVGIDPATGEVTGSAFVGSEPNRMAVSADGRYLYVGLDGVGAVRRVLLPTLTPEIQFSLGSSEGLHTAEDLAVRPGEPEAVAVSRMAFGWSPRSRGVAIYRDGVGLPETAQGVNAIEFGSSPLPLGTPETRLYGYEREGSSFLFSTLRVGPSGVTTDDVTQYLLQGFTTDIEFDDGLIYTSNGRVFDPEASSVLGRYAIGDAMTVPLSSDVVEPSSARRSTYFLKDRAVAEFDQRDYTHVQTTTLPESARFTATLIEIDNGNLAFRTSTGQIVTVRFQPEPAAPRATVTAPDGITTDATSPRGAFVSYPASAAVNDRPVRVTCTPQPGSLFPIGETAVVCIASNGGGVQTTERFTVTVNGAERQIDVLRLQVSDIADSGLRRRLDTSLRIARTSAATDARRACRALTRFVTDVRRRTPQKLSRESATAWIADAGRIRAVIACATPRRVGRTTG